MRDDELLEKTEEIMAEIAAGTLPAARLKDLVTRALLGGFEYGPPAAPVELPRAKMRSRERAISARGRGTETFALLVRPDGTTDWADQHPSAMLVDDDWCPRGIRASERRCSTTIEVDAGLIVIEMDKPVPSGPRYYRAGVTTADGTVYESQERCPVVHVGNKAGNVHVLKHRATDTRVEVGPHGPTNDAQRLRLADLAADCVRFAMGGAQ